MLRSKEWPLVTFTVFSQMAVGAFLALMAFRWTVVRWATPETIDEVATPMLPVIGGVLIIGALAATFHLTRLSRAIHAMANVGSSGLSREMLMGLLFGVTFGFYAGPVWLELLSPVVRAILALIVAIVGVGFIAVMARAYMLRTVPAWNAPATPIAFFGTAFLLGALAIGAALLIVGPDHVFCTRFARGLGMAAAVVLGVQFIATILHLARLNAQGNAAAESARVVFVHHRVALVLQWVLAIVGVGFFNLAAFWGEGKSIISITGFVLAFVAQMLGRFLFYVSYRRVGI